MEFGHNARTWTVGAVLSALALSGCTEKTGTTPTYSTGGGGNASSITEAYEEATSALGEAYDEASEQIACAARNIPTEDCDNDTVPNENDARPGQNDLVDGDGDGVLNAWDKYPGYNDKKTDLDNDAIPDYLDTFYGDNNTDADQDTLSNGYDPQPYTAPESGVATQPPINIASQVYGHGDQDLDGIIDTNDYTPDVYTNDRDGDGEADFSDPEPGNKLVTSLNDPYDPRNDEYWEN